MKRCTKKLIKIYYSTRNSSSKKAVEWFKNKGIAISAKRIQHISKEDLMHVLSMSEQGFTDILKKTGKCNSNIERMKFSEGVLFIQNHVELLKLPIIIGKNKLMIGYNSEEIRKFIPKNYRKF